MADNLTKEQRSYCMSRVRAKDTSPERTLRAELHRRGLRFRKHVKELPGKPDVVFRGKRVAVFVDGEFWHGYRYAEWRDSLSDAWRAKIESNRARDRRNHEALAQMGWSVIRVWQHEIEGDLDGCVSRVASAVR
jgi:DNA mismatch endonuclease, patch repair protein